MEYEIEDLMSAAIAQKSMDFDDAFKSMMIDKITDAIKDKKIELAQGIFNNPEENITKEAD